jgi:hypothetical protein
VDFPEPLGPVMAHCKGDVVKQQVAAEHDPYFIDDDFHA